MTESPSNSYEVPLKLTDFGTSHVRKLRYGGYDNLGNQLIANGMYSEWIGLSQITTSLD
jgi:hypothetical protein